MPCHSTRSRWPWQVFCCYFLLKGRYTVILQRGIDLWNIPLLRGLGCFVQAPIFAVHFGSSRVILDNIYIYIYCFLSNWPYPCYDMRKILGLCDAVGLDHLKQKAVLERGNSAFEISVKMVAKTKRLLLSVVVVFCSQLCPYTATLLTGTQHWRFFSYYSYIGWCPVWNFGTHVTDSDWFLYASTSFDHSLPVQY